VLLLALDTATPAVTVALHDGAAVVAASAQVDARRHGELLLPAVDRVLAAAGARLADVTDIAVGVGPGPYTGLRVGLMTADTFGFTLGVPVHGVCTLDGLAYAYGTSGDAGDAGGPFAVATDARRKEVYWARYADARTRVEGPAVARPAELAPRLAGVPVVGEGAFLYPEAFPDAREPRHVAAAAVAGYAAERLAAGGGLPAGGVRSTGRADRADDAAHVPAGLLPPRPLYLRRPDAQVPKNYKVVTPR
jgi:tRNA threonylcarbamoyl adenosine modification protein YeaZ